MNKIYKSCAVLSVLLCFSMSSVWAAPNVEMVVEREITITLFNEGDQNGKYTGMLVFGLPQGDGVFSSVRPSDGVEWVYTGSFENGTLNGEGVVNWSSGSFYFGEFKDGARHGQGTYIWPNGDVYDGTFQNGVIHGQGTYTWQNGNIFEGEIKDGQLLNGRHLIDGTWHDVVNGELVEFVDADQNIRILVSFFVIVALMIFAAVMLKHAIKIMRNGVDTIKKSLNIKTAPTANNVVKAIKKLIRCKSCGSRNKIVPGEACECRFCRTNLCYDEYIKSKRKY